MILGSYVYPVHPAPPATVSLAKVSVTAFKSLINPALSKSYASAKGSLVDVTAATGAYGPLTKTVKTKRYGRFGSGRQGLQAQVVLFEGRHPLQDAGVRRDRQAHRLEVQRGQAEMDTYHRETTGIVQRRPWVSDTPGTPAEGRDLVVIDALNDWNCTTCGQPGDLMSREDGGPLCMKLCRLITSCS